MGSGVFNLDDSADRAGLKSLIAVQIAGGRGCNNYSNIPRSVIGQNNGNTAFCNYLITFTL